MFDTIAAIWAGFSGKLKDSPRGRKIVWVLLVTFVAGWLATLFAAWISYPSYYTLVDFVNYGQYLAIFFTLAVAGFLYFAMAYCAGWLNEKWMHIPEQDRNYIALGFRVFFFSSLIFLGIDFKMNMDGAETRAEDAAGAVITYTYTTPSDVSAQLVADRKKLDEIESGKIGGYGWRNAADGVFYLNQSGKRATKATRESIRRLLQSDSTDKAAFIADQTLLNGKRDGREAKIHQTLRGAVYGVYLLIFLLCIVQGYCVELIQLEQKAINNPGAGNATPPKAKIGIKNRWSNLWNGTPAPAATPTPSMGQSTANMPPVGWPIPQGTGQNGQGQNNAGASNSMPGSTSMTDAEAMAIMKLLQGHGQLQEPGKP